MLLFNGLALRICMRPVLASRWFVHRANTCNHLMILFPQSQTSLTRASVPGNAGAGRTLIRDALWITAYSGYVGDIEWSASGAAVL